MFDLGFASEAASAERAKAWGIGLNWYLNRWLKMQLNFDRTRFDGGGGLDQDDRDTESVVFVRWQVAY